MNKKDFRIKAKNIRNSIPKNDRKNKSILACENLFRLPMFNSDMQDENVMLYLNFDSEISNEQLIDSFRKRNANIYLPRVISFEDATMDIVLYNEGDKVKKNKYGIKEPVSNETISPEELDYIIVPALAFDNEMRRLGYGGGFYDRILSSIPEHCVKIGFSYYEQIFDEIPYEKHDQKMDLILSDKLILADENYKM